MKIICIGRNYSDHIKELANIRPSHPVVFLKPDSSIIPKNQNFIIPAFSDEIHHEVELVVKINKVGKHIDESFSNKYYNEIGLGIDFTARDVQNTLKQKGHPWEKSKAFDNSCLVGEFIIQDEAKNQAGVEQIDDQAHQAVVGSRIQPTNTPCKIAKPNDRADWQQGVKDEWCGFHA